MNKYLYYGLILFLAIFLYFYTNKLIDYSSNNNEILSSIDNYALSKNVSCIEGNINEDGIVLGYSGLVVDKNKSYSNMKGSAFNKDLIEYKKDNCILVKENNYDKYIVSGNKYENNISIIIDVIDEKYYLDMIDILNRNNIKYNLSVDNDNKYNEYVIYKGNDIKKFYKKNKQVYCTNIKYDILSECKKYKINSINSINYISKDLLLNTKKVLNNGIIIFIKESNINLNELEPTLNYIKSRKYNIVDINELLS